MAFENKVIRPLALVALIGVGFQPAAVWSASSTLFEQPAALDGVQGHFIIPKAMHGRPETGAFHMVLWQPNPNRPDGMLLPSSWKAGDKTGFFPSAPVDKHQESFRDAVGSTTVQVDGDTVGAYINSADLVGGSHKYKMMITPEESFAPGDQVRPFAQPGRVILVTLDLQIPTAVDEHRQGSETYVVADLLFVNGSRGTKISYGCNLFFNGHARRESGGHIKLDEDSQNMMVNSAVMPGNEWLTVLPDSAASQSGPWKGWKTFRFAITEQNFSAALAAYRERDPNVSTVPADYSFAKFHLNAEMHFMSAPTELGWSMRHAKVSVEDASIVKR